MENAEDIEKMISRAMSARISDFRSQADSLRLEGVRRELEKDLGLDKFALDAHKKFVKQCLHECFDKLNDANASKSAVENSEKVVHSEKEEMANSEELQPKKEVTEPGSEDEEKLESAVPREEEMTELQMEEVEGAKSEESLSEAAIKKAIKKRASYFRANSETITLSGARRLLEEDLKLEKNALDGYKSLISEQIDEVLHLPEEVEPSNGFKKQRLKKTPVSIPRGKGCKGSRKVSGVSDVSDSDANVSGEEDVDEQDIRSKKQSVKKGTSKNTEGLKKRKRSSEEGKPSSNGKSKSAKSATDRSSNNDEGGNSSEDDKSQSAEEHVKKKREASTQVYGKRVEHLKSLIKACGMSVPPSVYKRAKQAPDNKREAHLIKELEEILGKEGLSTNPSEKEIKEVRKRKERAKELEGIDTSNIVSSTRRRSTFSFIMPPPKPSVVEKNNDNGDDGHGNNEEDTDDEESESEEASEESNEDVEDESD